MRISSRSLPGRRAHHLVFDRPAPGAVGTDQGSGWPKAGSGSSPAPGQRRAAAASSIGSGLRPSEWRVDIPPVSRQSGMRARGVEQQASQRSEEPLAERRSTHVHQPIRECQALHAPHFTLSAPSPVTLTQLWGLDAGTPTHHMWISPGSLGMRLLEAMAGAGSPVDAQRASVVAGKKCA